MALSEEQKAINKEATKLRNRAFAERKRAYRSACESALEAIQSGPLAHATVEADKQLADATQARDTELQSIKDRIQALQREYEQAQAKHQALIDPIHVQRSAAFDAKRSAENEVNKAIAAQFPDVADCYSAVAWKPLEEFIR